MGAVTIEEMASQVYREIREDFPDMTFKQFKELVRTPWKVLADEMRSPEYTPVRLHFFGLFYVPPSMARKGQRTADHSLKKNIITQEQYDFTQTKLNNILSYTENKNKKDEDTEE